MICNNVDSQRAHYPVFDLFSYNHSIKLTNQQQLIEIKRGSWGLGAFTTQRLQAKQLIGGK